jgi:amino acid adenylation domain-containing protein
MNILGHGMISKAAEQSGESLRRGALSIAQERLWVLEQLHPGSAAQNVARGIRRAQGINESTLEAALNELAQRHEILRTEFRVVDGMPTQLVRSASKLALQTVDLRQVAQSETQSETQSEREGRFLRLAEGEAGKTFDLAGGGLLRATLFRLSDTDHAIVLVAHRMVCDATSLSLLLNELLSGYEARANGKPLPSEIPAQYCEVVSEQSVPPAHLSYWTQRLAGAPASIDLPADHPRPALQTFRGARQKIRIHIGLKKELEERGQKLGATLFSTLLAVFSILVSRYSRQDDLVVGTPVSGRGRPELEKLIGPLENMLALRIDLSGGPTFAELLARVNETVEQAFSHQDVPFELLLEKLPMERDLSRNPLFQVAFSLRSGQADRLGVSAAGGSDFAVESGAERFEISLDLAEFPDSVEGTLNYNSDLFDSATMARMAEQFCMLAARFAAGPASRIFDVSPLSDAERHRVLVEFNATDADYRRDLCIHHFFEAQVERTPQATALICGQARLTYCELNWRANQVAHYLREQGVGPEVLVGVCCNRSIEMLVGIMGVLKAGGAYVPLDPAYPKERLQAIIEDAKAPILLAQQESARILPNHAARVIRLDADWPEIAAMPATNLTANATASNLGYVLFTSGSTGRPKGVALEHRSAAIFIQWAKEIFLPEEVKGTLFSTSVCFDLSVFEIFVPLSMGGKVIIAENALALPKLSAASEVTLINTVPSAIAELVRMIGVPPSVRVVNLAGEALPTSLAQQIYERTSVSKVYNLYGPTEDTTYSTYTLVPRGGEVTIGRPLPNTQAYILDENREPLPIGVPGELYLAGDGLARGYFGREDLTRERFVPNPFRGSGSRMYRTGDLARFRADGEIQYLGRIDNQVKLRGFRIELGEIEAVLAKHPSVQAAVVIVREDSPGDKRLVAYVVPSGESVSAALLQDVARQRLPEYMIPSAFVELPALPLSPNGKINRRLLPVPDWSSDGEDLVKPRTELESTLVRIWQDVLGVPNVGVQDNFFDLGGHSIMAARVLNEVKKTTGKDLPFSALFRGATVESLARLIENEPDVEGDPLLMEIQHGEKDRLPFFAIVPPGEESLGYAILARHMGPQQTVYKVQGHAPVTGGQRPYSEAEMQALTEESVAAMRSVQPHGPYCLGGLCDGTHIAEQIVLKLEAQGEEVGLFAIFDTWVLQHSQNRWLWKIFYYGQRLREMKKLSLAERLASYKRVARNKIEHLAGSKPARTDWQQTYWPEDFNPTQFHAPVILFKRPKQPFYYIEDPQMGWGKRTTTGVEIHEVDFSHAEILREPHVCIFGEQLAACVARVSAVPVGTKNNELSLVTGSAERQGS